MVVLTTVTCNVISFQILVREVTNHLIEKGRLIRIRTPVVDHLLMVLWILATPDTFRSVALRFGVYPSGVHDAYRCVLLALIEMGERYVNWPNQEERSVIKRRLERVS